GGLAPEMRPALWTCAAAFLLLFTYLLRRRLFVETARQDVEMLGRRIEMLR
ncbi:MAG: hypothetical protein H6Q06_724, partial [Acidobacteria bacterium]|nr:hypothetical protein [Acidobacteriota bacterium]